MKQISVVFAGTAAFGVPILEALLSDSRFSVTCVITAPDKPAGRNLEMTSSPIKNFATLNKLFIQQPKNNAELKQKIAQISPDILLVVAYGLIIKDDVLSIPKIGAINIHGSLLPKYRGSSPIQEAILRGDKKTGITWIVMNEKVDRGDVVGQQEIEIDENDTYQTLSQKLADLAACFTPNVLMDYASNKKAQKQDEKLASYCRKIKKDDGFIDIHGETAEEIVRKIRAYTPWPECYIFWNNSRLKIIEAQTSEQKISSGMVVAENGEKLLVGTKEKAISLLSVQPESKRKMLVREFLAGQKNIPHKI